MISINRIKQIIEKEEEGSTLDYKENLPLETDGDKAKFVKDVISLANSRQIAHIITGVEDGTRKLVGIKTHHKAEQLNQILKDKTDPPLRVEYAERNIMGHIIGVIEITGDNPPYIVAVPDKFGGLLSSDPQKQFFIERGTVFVRNYNMNEGAKRADLDKMHKVQYVTLEADLQLSHRVSVKPAGNFMEANIQFMLLNQGEVLAADPYVWMKFKNVNEIVRCTGDWDNQTSVNNNIPTIRYVGRMAICPRILTRCDGAVVKVNKNTVEIVADLIKVAAGNMRVKEGSYAINLRERSKKE